MPRKNNEKIQNIAKAQSSPNIDSAYECVGPSENVFMRKQNNVDINIHGKKTSIDVPQPPPLPPPLKGNQHYLRNMNRDSNDSLDDIDFNQTDGDLSLESDSGLEVVEEPSLRPSELVRGNNNRSMSMISGELRIFFSYFIAILCLNVNTYRPLHT